MTQSIDGSHGDPSGGDGTELDDHRTVLVLLHRRNGVSGRA